MSGKETFEKRYLSGETPWELSRADKNLTAFVQIHVKPPKKVMDIGCGTGANARWAAQRGFDVTGVDVSPTAIEMAREQARNVAGQLTFMTRDFLADDIVAPDFDFVFDRGCFHAVEAHGDRLRFAKKVGRHLKEGGLWFSILGSCDDAPRDHGPPMRSAVQIVQAVEPYFEIQSIIADRFDSRRERPAKCWLCAFKKRRRQPER